MMAEIKKGFKLLRYGYALKMNCIAAILFLVVGVLALCIGEAGILMATIYILMAPALLIQLVNNMLYAGLAASSPKRKMLEIYFPDFMTMIIGVLGYLIVVGAAWFWANKRPENVENCVENMFVSSLVVAVILIYFSVAYKYFFTSILMFVSGVFVGISGGLITLEFLGGYFTMVTSSIVSLLVIAAAVVISGLLRRAFYRKQISPMAGGLSLRKAMQ